MNLKSSHSRQKEVLKYAHHLLDISVLLLISCLGEIHSECGFLFFFSEVDLPLKKDGFTSESTTLEALLRGEGIEKKTDTKEEDTIQEIQVKEIPMPWHQGWILQFVSKSSSLLSCGRTVYLLIVVSFCCQNVIKPLCYTVMPKMMSVSHTLLLSQDLCCLTVICTGPVLEFFFAALWDNYIKKLRSWGGSQL